MRALRVFFALAAIPAAFSLCSPGFCLVVTKEGSSGNYNYPQQCKPCTIGTSSATGADWVECASGSEYSDGYGTYCYYSINPAWYYHLVIVSCPLCVAGTYQDTPGASSCKPCPAGTWSTRVGLQSSAGCVPCAAGNYSSDGSTSCTSCAAGSWALSGSSNCVLCSPGTYSLAGAATCAPCPAGTYGGSAGLASAACSGPCPGCPSGMAFPPLSTQVICASSGARSPPASFGLQMWPAAHPTNPQGADLIIATLSVCQQLGGTCSTAPANTLVGEDGATRYIVGTAAAMHLEADEVLACSV